MGIVLIELKEDSIKNLLSFRLENLGYLFLQYSRTGFTSSRDQIPDSRYLTKLAKNQKIDENLLKVNNEMVLLRPMETKGLKLAGIINLKKLTKDSKGMGLILLAAMSISLVISFLSAYVLSSSIVKPLQAQINPHFLYNTLDSINWLAREGKNAEVDRMVTALTILFRKGISRDKDVIPLKDELEHVRNYLVIQKIRYGNQFSYELDIPDKALSGYMSLKLILQPVC